MTRSTRWLLAATFLAGCVSTLAFQVPRARADGPPVRKWEHWCTDVDGVPSATNPQLQKAGEEGWELVVATFRPPVVQSGNSVGGGATYLCFKRPR